MKLYAPNIEESYKDTIIGRMVNSVAADLLLHIVQCWCACAVNEEIQIYIWFYNVHTWCLNIILVLDFRQSKIMRKGVKPQ